VALYKVKLRVDYVLDILIENAPSADEAKRRAAFEATKAVERAFPESTSMIGQAQPLSAVCVNSLE
jgi:hypothetical protein